MVIQNKSDNFFVTELDRLFFEIGQKMATFKTPVEQQLFLRGVLEKLEEKKKWNPDESTLDEKEETRNALDRLYLAKFARWGLTQMETLITSESVMKAHGFFSHKEKCSIRRSLLEDFARGWKSKSR